MPDTVPLKVPNTWILLFTSILFWIALMGIVETILRIINVNLKQRLVFYIILAIITLSILKIYETQLPLIL